MAQQLFQGLALDANLSKLLCDRIDLERRWLAWVAEEFEAVRAGERSDLVLRANRELVDAVFNLLERDKLDDALTWLEAFAPAS